MSTIKQAFRAMRQRERARHNLWSFADQTALRKIAKRVPAPHHEFICGALQSFMADPDASILCLLMPPGSAKTLFASQILPAWAMGVNPGTRVVAISNSLPLAETNGRAVREILGSAAYRRIFDSTVTTGSGAAGAFTATNGSSFFAAGAGGAVLGRRAELVVCDDLVSGIEEAQSATQMDKLWDAFKANIITRLVPGAKLLVVMQRLAHNDPAGRLLELKAAGLPGRRIDVIRLPMMADTADDPMGRKPGEILWNYYTPAMIADHQRDPLLWKTLYQQNPAATTGEWCAASDLIEAPRPRGVIRGEGWNVLIGADIASTVGGGDATVFVVMAVSRRTGEMHFMDLYREHVNGAVAAEALLDLVEVWAPLRVLIDNDGGSRGFVSHLKTRAVGKGVPVVIEEVAMRGRNKEARAGALRAKIKSGLVHLDRSAPWAADVLREFVGFPYLTGSAVDDIVDAAGLIAGKTSVMMARDEPPPIQARTKFVMTDMNLDDLHADQAARSRFNSRIA